MTSSSFEYRMGTLDYAVVIAVIVVSAVIGLYFAWKSRKYKTTRDFLVAGTNFGVIPLALSVNASQISPHNVLGLPAEAYNNGFQIVLQVVMYAIACIIAVYTVVPVYYRLKVGSVFQYLEYRFNPTLKNVTALLYVVKGGILMSSLAHLTSLVLSDATGISYWTSMSIICGTCALYTSMGGFAAVIWTDALQMIIIFASIIAISVKGTLDNGGISKMWKTSYEGNRTIMIRYLSDNSTNYSIWSLTLGSGISMIGSFLTSQSLLQREMANKNVREAKLTVVISTFFYVLTYFILSWIGLILFSRYSKCDPLLSKQIRSRDQMIAYYAKELFNEITGLTGLFVAGLLAASLSTLSSITNCVSTVLVVNFVKPYWPSLTDQKTRMLSKVLGILHGAVTVLLTLITSKIEGIVQLTYMITGATAGPTFGVFLLGFFFPWVTALAATSAYVCGIAFCWWASIGRLIYYQGKFILPASKDGCTDSNFDLFNMTVTSASHNFSSVINKTIFSSPEIANILINVTETTGTSKSGKDVFALYIISPLWYPSMAILIIVAVGLIVSAATGIQDLDTLDPNLISPFTWFIIRRLPENWRRTLGFKSAKFTGSMTLSTICKDNKGLNEEDRISLSHQK